MKMVEKSSLAKSIVDASWNQFPQILAYKGEEAGRKLGVVNTAYTSQTCYQCGYTVSRDLNVAQNILALGLDGLGAIPRSLRL